jgi:photosystem II stability/assembly factor-like uncharacterized protein
MNQTHLWRLLPVLLFALSACTGEGKEPGAAPNESPRPSAVASNEAPRLKRTLRAVQLAFWNSEDGLVLVKADCHTCVESRLGLVLGTDDGGQSWNRVFRATGVARDVVTVGDRTALASIGGTLFRTFDAGKTWTAAGSTRGVGAIAFPSPSIGWGVRPPTIEGKLVATTDGGRTWDVAVQPCGRSVRFDGPMAAWHRARVDFLSDVWFVSPEQGWALCAGDGAGGSAPVAIYRTADGGSTWTEQQALLDVEPGGLQFLSSRIGWRWGFGDGQTERTADGGRTWHLQRGSFADTGAENSIWFVSSEIGYALDAGRVWRTENGGHTWKVVNKVAPE